MDVDIVEAIAKAMHEKAQSTTSVVESAGRLIRGSEKLWLGQRADRWLADWLIEEAAVRRAAAFLTEMSNRLTVQVNQQRLASGPGPSPTIRGGGTSSQARKGGLPSVGKKDVGTPGHGQWGRAADRAGLSRAVEGGSLPPGWRRVGDDELTRMGVDSGLLHGQDGFAAAVFVNSEGNLVTAFAGTNFGDMRGDVAADVAGELLHGVTSQDKRAVALAIALDHATDGKVEFTGHSLGGRLASLAGVATGEKATTFDSAGPSNAALRFAGEQAGITVGKHPRELAKGLVTDYENAGQVLGLLQDGTPLPNAVGDRVQLPPSRPRMPSPAANLVADVFSLGVPMAAKPLAEVVVSYSLDAHSVEHIQSQLQGRAFAKGQAGHAP